MNISVSLGVRKKKYIRRPRPTDEQIACMNQEAATELAGIMTSKAMTAYGLALEAGLDYETVRRTLNGKSVMHWTYVHLKRTLV